MQCISKRQLDDLHRLCDSVDTTLNRSANLDALPEANTAKKRALDMLLDREPLSQQGYAQVASDVIVTGTILMLSGASLSDSYLSRVSQCMFSDYLGRVARHIAGNDLAEWKQVVERMKVEMDIRAGPGHHYLNLPLERGDKRIEIQRPMALGHLVNMLSSLVDGAGFPRAAANELFDLQYLDIQHADADDSSQPTVTTLHYAGQLVMSIQSQQADERNTKPLNDLELARMARDTFYLGDKTSKIPRMFVKSKALESRIKQGVLLARGVVLAPGQQDRLKVVERGFKHLTTRPYPTGCSNYAESWLDG
ncbi:MULTISPECIES: hypothetical protein [Halomonas]|uniref:hypothetical protein n=1 Tax=Halomonas TaxID=2745 RepID=UPI003CF4375F